MVDSSESPAPTGSTAGRQRPPQQGEIWLADLNPPVGHEQAGPPRPVLILSASAMNRAPYALSIVVPLSTRIRNVPGHVFLPASESGLRADSEIMCERVRSISHRRLRSDGPLSHVSLEVVQGVVVWINRFLDVGTGHQRPHSGD